MPGPRISHQACHASSQTICVSVRVFYLLSAYAYFYLVDEWAMDLENCVQNLSFRQLQCKLAMHTYLHACVCESVRLCLKREGGSVHQISYLIWAASGGVKGAVGRLSSLRQKKETESRWRECERGWEGGREGEDRRVKRGEEWDKEWKR